MAASTTHYDVLFLGSGQSANPLAKLFAKTGRRTAVVERADVGGTCVNVGCTPTKTMIASGRVAYLARRAGEYGVRTGGEEGVVGVDMETVRKRKRDIVKQWHDGSLKGLEGAGVELVMGEARFVTDKTVRVKLNGGGGGEREMTADTVFISVGTRPSQPKMAGLETVDGARVLDSTSIMELAAVPRHLVIVGGGYIGLEFGQLLRRLGAAVTIVQRNRQLLPREDDDVAACMLDILREDGVAVHLSTTVESVARGKGAADDEAVVVNVKGPAGTTAIPGSHLLVATGRVSNTDSLNLSAGGVKADARGFVAVDDKLQTSAPNVYALGDCHGGPAFTHMSFDDSRIIRSNLLRDTMAPQTPHMPTTSTSKSRVLTPYVVYTDPQLGHVGLHAQDLRSAPRNIRTASMPMSSVARATETAEPRGMMKAAVDAETGEILGFTCLGLEGGEIMSVVQTAMMGGLKWWDLEAAVYTHPTLAEGLNNLWAYLK